MTDYTEGFINWEYVPGPYLTGTGMVTYQGKQYLIDVSGFEIGTQFTGSSYIKFKGPPSELAGNSVNFSIGLGLGLGISVGSSGTAAIAEVGSLGLSTTYNWTNVVPVDPGIEQKGSPGDPSGIVGRYSEWELIAETSFTNLQTILLHAYALGLDKFDETVNFLDAMMQERLLFVMDLISELYHDLMANGTPSKDRAVDLQQAIPGKMPLSAAGASIFIPSLLEKNYRSPSPINKTDTGELWLGPITINGEQYGGWTRAYPIVLDLNGDNSLDILPISTDAPSAFGPTFDWNGDGVADQTTWVGPTDGLLVIDLAADGSTGGDGKIDQAREIAFALWKTEDERQKELKEQGIDDTGRPVTDLEGLRYAFDTNGDNILDSNDARWDEFRVWQDLNQNGIADEGELRTLDEAAIELINLMPSLEGSKTFPDGSAITGTSTALKSDGTAMLVGDTTFAYRPSSAAP
ncbi:hypothetical protein [Brucella intermedia]|uniref:hypothetical protein n=1 Tax=Brucella intermedia TaxID=94625 RepID=UPI00224B8158|nr:hypothetical protein [Brucella intermedia]